MVEEIKENQFDSIINGNVIVDCYAPWCGPCKMLSPIIDELAKEVSTYNFYKLNVDEAEGIAMRYGIMSIPTILVFENGVLKHNLVGFKTKEELKTILGA